MGTSLLSSSPFRPNLKLIIIQEGAILKRGSLSFNSNTKKRTWINLINIQPRCTCNATASIQLNTYIPGYPMINWFKVILYVKPRLNHMAIPGCISTATQVIINYFPGFQTQLCSRSVTPELIKMIGDHLWILMLS